MDEMTHAHMVQALRDFDRQLQPLRQQPHASCVVCEMEYFYALPDGEYQCLLCGQVQIFPGERVLSIPSPAYGHTN